MLPDYATCAVRKLENLFVSQYKAPVRSDICYFCVQKRHTIMMCLKLTVFIKVLKSGTLRAPIQLCGVFLSFIVSHSTIPPVTEYF